MEFEKELEELQRELEVLRKENEELKRIRDGIDQLAQNLLLHPEIGDKLHEVLSKEYGIPLELPQEKKITKQMREQLKTELKSEIDSIKQELEEQKRRQLIENIKGILNKYGLTESDYQAVRDYMLKNGIVSFDTGARLYAQEKLSTMRRTSNVFSQEFMKETTEFPQSKDDLYKRAEEIWRSIKI